jgi:hypothetical protein
MPPRKVPPNDVPAAHWLGAADAKRMDTPKLSEQLSTAVRAAIVLAPDDRAAFVGAHLRAQHQKAPPPTAISDRSKPTDRAELQAQLLALADTLTAAVNAAAGMPGAPLENVAMQLLQTVEAASHSRSCSCAANAAAAPAQTPTQASAQGAAQAAAQSPAQAAADASTEASSQAAADADAQPPAPPPAQPPAPPPAQAGAAEAAAEAPAGAPAGSSADADDAATGDGVSSGGHSKGKKTARFASGTSGPERVGEPPPQMAKTYVGETDAEGLPHGVGRAEYANGDVYEGAYKADRREGQGTCTYASGEAYDGEWKADKREGKGVARYVSGDTYDGQWRFGKREGCARAAARLAHAHGRTRRCS